MREHGAALCDTMRAIGGFLPPFPFRFYNDNKQHPMFKKLIQACLVSAALAAALPAHAGLGDFWSALIDTTPAGLVRQSAERDGSFGSFWDDTVKGSKSIMDNGVSLWVMPTYTNHPRWDWPQRREENGYPFGMGLGRQVIDDHGNERLLFLVNFVDSNYRIEPTFGYSWVARWPVANTGLHVGAGYLAGFTIRGDYMWAPIPMPLPVLKVGTETIGFYGTWIPITNVYFFYTSIAIDDRKRRDGPLPKASPWSEVTDFVYGGYGHMRTDNGEPDTKYFMSSNSSYHAGWRHYSGRHWATDISYRHSEHGITVGAARPSVDIDMYALQLQYNIDAFDTLRLYGGGGFGYSRAKSEAGRDDSSIHPVLSMGATWAATRHLFIDASITTSFSRFKGVVDGAGSEYVLKPMPVDLAISAGLAF